MDFATVAHNLIHRLNPSFRYRWEIYDKLLLSYLSKEKIWLDLGCGKNVHDVELHRDKVKYAVGIDILSPKGCPTSFIQADMRSMPLQSGCADLITLRFVMEHLEKIPEDLSDVVRVLKLNGHLIIFTTNIYSPFVFLAKFLPFSIKSFLLRLLFGAESSDIFPTYHQLNSPLKFKRIFKEFKLDKFMYIENIAVTNVFVFVISAIWYLITRIEPIEIMRSNLLVAYRKDG